MTQDVRRGHRAEPLPVEPLPVGPLQAVVSGFATVTVGAFVAAGIVFGVVLIGGILSEEVLRLPSVYDVAFRASLAMVLLWVALMIPAEMVRNVVDKWMRLRAAEARFAAPEAPRLPAAEHRRLRADPYGSLVAVAWFAVVLGPIVVLAAFVAGLGPAVAVGVTLVGIALTLGAILLFVTARRFATAWDARAARLPASVASARRRHTPTRGWNVAAAVALQLGVYAFFGGVVLRQPCRDCDPVDYGDSPIEGLIDVLVGLGGALVVVPVVLLLLTTLPHLVRTALAERRTLRAARAGTLQPGDEVAAQLLDLGTLERLAYGLTVLGFTLLMLGGTSWGALANDHAASEDVAALEALHVLLAPGAGLVLAGLAAGIAGVVEARSRRAAIHAALPGFDCAPPAAGQPDGGSTLGADRAGFDAGGGSDGGGADTGGGSDGGGGGGD
ncbi:hypothetical protein [Microbacterium sp. NPDC096154]|uniref:hypothetical protein n=1 Tax=Microbacterium sp. NPDC096154 TaxID=3155549 RepID=UPI00331D1D09